MNDGVKEGSSTAVFLLNLGGPDSISAVKPFLVNLFSDQDIINLPVQPLLARIIASRRAKKVIPRYVKIGGKSPLLDLTLDQAKALETELNAGAELLPNYGKFSVYVGMRYWHPFIGDAVKEIARAGHRRLVALTLFPHYSRATTGSCFKELRRALKHQKNLSVIYIDHWYDNPLYLDALAEKVREGLDKCSSRNPKRVQILFTAHSLPQDFVDQGDPYLDHLNATIRGLKKRLGGVTTHLAFQSRSGPVKWLEPSTEQAIDNLAHDGYRELLMVPLSFVSDHIETLYEIDIMYREQAESHGILTFRRTESLNSSPRFIRALANIVTEELKRSEADLRSQSAL